MKINTSLIISVYNKVDFLKLVLAGISRQSYENFEVLIADDGSDKNIREFIDTYRTSVPFPIQHLWHDDKGWRKNKILNEAIRTSSSDYLIFIDGDCIPHRYFIEAHINERRANAALCGKRVMLSERITKTLSPTDIINGALEHINIKLILDSLGGRASRLEDGIFIKSGIIRKLVHRNGIRILGSNFSIEKSMMEKINGFDEDYVGAGIGEDADVQYRLELLGITLHSVKNYAIQYHLYHQRTMENSENQKIFHDKKLLSQVFCKNGIKKL